MKKIIPLLMFLPLLTYAYVPTEDINGIHWKFYTERARIDYINIAERFPARYFNDLTIQVVDDWNNYHPTIGYYNAGVMRISLSKKSIFVHELAHHLQWMRGNQVNHGEIFRENIEEIMQNIDSEGAIKYQ